MKKKVKDLEANPFRNIAKYPIDRVKVEALKTSIKETTFWDNILVRPHPTKKGKYQIAYGHHRDIALKELKITEVDIPVRKLTDSQMVKIMAEENLQWMTSPTVINETVLAAKKFLDTELTKYKTYDEYKKAEGSINLFVGCKTKAGKPVNPKAAFGQAKGKQGVGRGTILRFLGGNWSESRIQIALRTLDLDRLPADKGGVDREAVETLPTMEQARVFQDTLQNHKIPKPTQRRIAQKIKDEGIGRRGIPETIREIAKPEHLDRAKKKTIPTLDTFVENMLNPMRNVQFNLIKIKPNIGDIQSPRVRRQLLRECDDLMKVLKDIKVTECKHAKTG